jgi:hypothetical protein
MLFAAPTTDVLPVVSVYILLAVLYCENLQERLFALYFAWTKCKIAFWANSMRLPHKKGFTLAWLRFLPLIISPQI